MRNLARLAKRRLKYHVDGFHDLMQPIRLPRRHMHIRINFTFHVEDIAKTETYVAFREFVKRLAEASGVRPLLCVTTPHCPQTRYEMDLDHLCEEEYAERVKELAKFAEIGYHGHFFSKEKAMIPDAFKERVGDTIYSMQWADGLNPMGSSNFNRATVEAQMRKEIAWLQGIGMDPFAYVAGWWFMNEDIALLLEAEGIRVDFSVRQKHPDTFGGRYLENVSIPGGEPFVLPPTRKLVEIRSIFYPVVHPRQSKEFLHETAGHKPDEPLFVVFPSHEGEALHYGKEFMDNVAATRRMKHIFRWMAMSDQLKEAAKLLGLAE
ncbi:MAG: hypothetical protein GXP25_03005 [Planctomycetes bacterium]|nr:hypothetical protein [Planctomycetota bacterium]